MRIRFDVSEVRTWFSGPRPRYKGHLKMTEIRKIPDLHRMQVLPFPGTYSTTECRTWIKTLPVAWGDVERAAKLEAARLIPAWKHVELASIPYQCEGVGMVKIEILPADEATRISYMAWMQDKADRASRMSSSKRTRHARR